MSNLQAKDVASFLDEQRNKGLLRFITCGSVDDGKSTLIGRLLFESKAIFDDQLASLESDSRLYGTQGEKMDLALLVDGLQAEREQGVDHDLDAQACVVVGNEKRQNGSQADQGQQQ